MSGQAFDESAFEAYDVPLSQRAASPPPYMAGLNPAQVEAVEALDGSVLVLAGAGAGQTRVLTARRARIVHMRRAWPSQNLAVTFSNKAAREMKDRGGEM